MLVQAQGEEGEGLLLDYTEDDIVVLENGDTEKEEIEDLESDKENDEDLCLMMSLMSYDSLLTLAFRNHLAYA